MTRLGEEETNKKEERGDEKLLDARTIILAEEVSDALYRKAAVAITLLEQRDPKKPITVYVNSPGGSADSGFAIYDLLRFTSCPVRTMTNELVASAAVLIFLGAPPGKRLTLPSTRFLLHQPSTAARGQQSDIDIAAREIVKLRRRYNEIVAEATGRKVDEVEKDSDRDFWLTASEAKNYGLASRIITRRSELEES